MNAPTLPPSRARKGPDSTNTTSPRLALARAVRMGLVPPFMLGDELSDAIRDLEYLETLRLPAMAD